MCVGGCHDNIPTTNVNYHLAFYKPHTFLAFRIAIKWNISHTR